jgi:hypothetical protein
VNCGAWWVHPGGDCAIFDVRRAPARREYSVVVSARGFALLGCFVMATLAGVLVVDRASQVFVLLGAATTAAVIAVPSSSRWRGGSRAVRRS